MARYTEHQDRNPKSAHMFHVHNEKPDNALLIDIDFINKCRRHNF